MAHRFSSVLSNTLKVSTVLFWLKMGIHFVDLPSKWIRTKLLNISCCSTPAGLSSSSHQNLFIQGKADSSHRISDLSESRSSEKQLCIHDSFTKRCCQNSFPSDESLWHICITKLTSGLTACTFPNPAQLSWSQTQGKDALMHWSMIWQIFPAWTKVIERFVKPPAPKSPVKVIVICTSIFTNGHKR